MSVCLRDIDTATDEAYLRATFQSFNSLAEVHIVPGEKRRDAYVVFSDTREAIRAFEHAATTTSYRKKRKGLVLDRE